MTPAAFAEQYTPVPEIDIAINDAAAARGVSLEPDRLLQLAGAAKSIQAVDQIYGDLPDRERPPTMFKDTRNEVEVSRALFTDRFGATASKVDFAPTSEVEGDFVSGDTFARPEHATLFTLNAIHGLQNYVLLADAGVAEKPAILFGNTNPQMAILAERVGMLSDIARENPDDLAEAHKKMRQTPEMEIYGSFDEVSKRLFSEDTKKLEQLLTRRLATGKQAGEAALNS